MPNEHRRCVVVGPGRMGTAIAAALREAGWSVIGPLGRGEEIPHGAEAVLLCVPDGAIAGAAHAVPEDAGLLVGHCSGATTLDVLEPHERFSVHPLMTVTGPGTVFAGAAAAVSGSTGAASQFARDLADAVGLRPFEVPDVDRAAYHAGASVASNYLLALLAMAERLSGTSREDLAPLVQATVENWRRRGAGEALTGPVARGDGQTVERQRAAVAGRAPDLLECFDALTALTGRLASSREEVAA